MKIWKQIIFFQAFKVLVFSCFIFFILYVMIDISTHFSQVANIGILPLIKYYACHFSKRFDFILNFSLLLGSLHCIHGMNVHHEMLALQIAGVRNKSLVKPLMYLSIFVTIIISCNYEWIYPQAMKNIENFETTHFKDLSKKSKKRTMPIRAVTLNDEQQLVYSHLDLVNNCLNDVYLLQSDDTLYHMKFLDLSPQPVGRFVSLFLREQSKWELSATKEIEFFNFSLNVGDNDLFSWEIKPSSHLVKLQLSEQTRIRALNEFINAQIFFRLMKIFMPMLTLFAISPFAMTYKRNTSPLKLYTGAIFGYITCYIIIGALQILAENSLISSSLIFFVPMTFFCVLFLPRYIKL